MKQLPFNFVLIFIFVSCVVYYAHAFCHPTDDTNKYCKVGFNYTQCSDDKTEKIYGTSSSFEKCMREVTYYSNGTHKPFTIELYRCQAKCHQEALGYLNNDGTLSVENIAKVFKQAFKMYSNATAEYTEEVVKLVTNCVYQAEIRMQSWTTLNNKTTSENCVVNGYFSECYSLLDWKLRNDWNATIKICATQGTALKLDGENKADRQMETTARWSTQTS